MKYHRLIVGAISLLIPLSFANAQDASIPTETKKYPSYLNQPDAKTLEVLTQLKKSDAPYKGRWLEKFLKCDGQNGNSEMGEYANPDYFVIDEKGVCRYYSQGVQ